MKLTLGQIFSTQFGKNELLSQKFPIKVSYWIGKNMAHIDREFQNIEKTRLELVKKYGSEIKNPETQAVERITVPPEKQNAFQAEFQEFLKEDIDIDIKPINLSSVNVELSVQCVAAFEWMFDKPDEQEE